MLCPENLAAKDIGAFSHLLQQNATGEIIARLREQLEPFRAVAVLRAFDPTTRGILDDAEYEAIDTINVHFGARLKLAQLKYSICNRDLDMSFLSLVLEVDALINQIENRDQAPRQDAYPLDDYALLKAAIDGTLWRVANRAFEKPNPLETAIMIGNAAAVQEILRDRDALIGLGYGARSAGTLAERAQNIQFSSTITPLHAAERLEQVSAQLNQARGTLQAMGDPAVLSAQKERLEEKLSRRRLELDALSLAMDALTQANTLLQERFSPELNRLTGRYMARLTGDRYPAVSLTRELEGFVRGADGVLPRSALYLSRGTADQLYLALRLAVCRLCLPEKPPILLDDALASFDDARLEAALELLWELSGEQQLLLFTCQKREGEVLASTPGVTKIEL